jgi:hypothetical protein
VCQAYDTARLLRMSGTFAQSPLEARSRDVDTKYPTGYSGTSPCGYLRTTKENEGWWRLVLEVLTVRVQRKFEVINGPSFATLE